MDKFTITKFCQEEHISTSTYYEKIKNGFTTEQIIDNARAKKEQDTIQLNKLYDEGMPREYNSLMQYCIDNNLNYLKVYKGLQKGYELKVAVRSSLVDVIQKPCTYTISNIQLKSFCQKYELDYKYILRNVNQGLDTTTAIYKAIFNKAFLGIKGKQAEHLWNKFQNYTVGNQEGIDATTLTTFHLILLHMKAMEKELGYYDFLTHFEIIDCNIDDLVRSILIMPEYQNMYTLSELYYIFDLQNGLMADFDYNAKYNYWYYNYRDLKRNLNIKKSREI